MAFAVKDKWTKEWRHPYAVNRPPRSAEGWLGAAKGIGLGLALGLGAWVLIGLGVWIVVA
ncbi:MAG: hypothetical protein ACHQIO_09975 [Nevskiales bacterium]